VRATGNFFGPSNPPSFRQARGSGFRLRQRPSERIKILNQNAVTVCQEIDIAGARLWRAISKSGPGFASDRALLV
jgi:hypothetical protein